MLQWIYAGERVNIVDIIIVYNQKQKEMVEIFVSNVSSEYRHAVRLLGMDAEQASYYKMKNAGANIAKGEILVFLDSDLTPAIGTFFDFIQPLYDKAAVAVSGYASFPADNFIGRVYSLFWMFPIFNQPETMGGYQLFANSCAFKKEWFQKNNFPVELGGLRVACHVMSDRLKESGLTLHHPNVWFFHDLWSDSWQFFTWRALVMGRNADKKYSYKVSSLKSSRIKYALKNFHYDMTRLIRRHVRYYKTIDLPAWQVPASLLLGFIFWVLVRGSQIISSLHLVNFKQEKIPAKFLE